MNDESRDPRLTAGAARGEPVMLLVRACLVSVANGLIITTGVDTRHGG